MRLFTVLSVLETLVSCVAAASAGSNAINFKRPVIARLWQYDHYTLADHSPAVDIKDAAAAIAGLKPSYVCSTIRLQYGLDLSAKMVSPPDLLGYLRLPYLAPNSLPTTATREQS